jgi:DNA-binding transcriptional MerR regulator
MKDFPQLQLFADPSRPGAKGKPPCADKGSIPSEDRQYQAKHLWERHKIMKRMAVLGYSHKDIAETVGCTPQTVSNVLNSAMMKKEISLMQAALDNHTIDVAKEIQTMHPKALLVLNEILEDDDAPLSLRAKVAMDNLSRGGFSPVVRGVFDHSYHFSAEEIEALKQDAIAAGWKAGSIVDAEFTCKEPATEGRSRPADSQDIGISDNVDAPPEGPMAPGMTVTEEIASTECSTGEQSIIGE